MSHLPRTEYDEIIERVVRAIRPRASDVSCAHLDDESTIELKIDGYVFNCEIGSDDDEFVFVPMDDNSTRIVFSIPTDFCE